MDSDIAQCKPLGARKGINEQGPEKGCIFVKSESWEKVGEIVA
jgi:hypothetical protein